MQRAALRSDHESKGSRQAHDRSALPRRSQRKSNFRFPQARPIRHRRWVPRSASTASTSWSSARRSMPDPEAGGHDHPRRHHGVRGPVLHVHHQDTARRGTPQTGRGDRQGLRSAQPDKVGKVTREQVGEIAKTKLPDLNAARRRRRCASHRGLGPQHGHRNR